MARGASARHTGSPLRSISSEAKVRREADRAKQEAEEENDEAKELGDKTRIKEEEEEETVES